MRFLYRGKGGNLIVTEDLDEAEWPQYAVLSHTWLANNSEEITFHDVRQGMAVHKARAFAKINFCIDRAAMDGVDHVWIDTCCIDRSNTSELQEALVSMFRWYRKALYCYAYLSDVSATVDSDATSWSAAFRKSRWFTRSWTLQELLAPSSVEFFSLEGTLLGDKRSLQVHISEITGIPTPALHTEDLSAFSISERFSWAAHRQAKRKEDRAYSLLGIFGVFMTLIYGEGEHAFVRLHTAINDPEHTRSVRRSDHLLATLPVHVSAAFDSWTQQHQTRCLAGTRIEVLESLKQWACGTDDRLIYWLDGVAGSGKTTVARTIAAHFKSQGLLGGSFFFSKEGGISHGDRLCTTLAEQLARSIPGAMSNICSVIERDEYISRRAHAEQWMKLIIGPLKDLHGASNARPVVLVVDALDECDSDLIVLELLKVLADVARSQCPRLRILVTSRPSNSVKTGFSQIPETVRHLCILHDIDHDLVSRDLTAYFVDRLQTIAQDRALPSTWPGEEMIARLVKRSNGLFVWAATACEYIDTEGMPAQARVIRLLNSRHHSAVPENALDQIYLTILDDATLRAFDDEGSTPTNSTLKKILGACLVLSEPLSLEALALLLDISVKTIEDSVQPLAAVMAIYVSQTNRRTLKLLHPSFRSYLFDKTRCTDSRFWVNESKAHENVAKQCLRLMSSRLKQNPCNLSPPRILRRDVELDILEKSIPAELRYACKHWVEHYRRGQIQVKDHDETHRFMLTHFVHWVETLCLIGESSNMAIMARMYHSILDPARNAKQVPFIRVARRLIVAFQAQIDLSPLQVYSSALIYLKHSNDLRFHFWDQVSPLLKTIIVIEADSVEPKPAYNFVNNLAFTPDGLQLASGSVNERVRIWDVHQQALSTTLTGQVDKISTVAISSDGSQLASGSDDFSVRLWGMESKTCAHILKGHTGWVNAVSFTPDGQMLASGSIDETIRLWHTASGKELDVLECASEGVNDVSFSPSGRLLASANVSHSISLWDPVQRKLQVLLKGHSRSVNAVRFLRNSDQVVSGSDDMTVRVWDVIACVEVMKLVGHTRRVLAIACSHEGKHFASGSDDKTVRVWSALTGDLLKILDHHTCGVNAVAYSPDDTLMASCSADDEVRLWHASSGTLSGKLPDFNEHVTTMQSRTRSDRQLTSNGPLSPFWGKVTAHADAVTTLTFSPGGRLVVSGSADNTLRVWGREGTDRCTLYGHAGRITHAAFSPHAHHIASASSDRTARLWDSVTGLTVHVLPGHLDIVSLVRFSPDGKILATCSSDGTVKIWSNFTGINLGTLRGHSEKQLVTDVAFSPDSSQLVSCSHDTTICLWNPRTTRMLWANSMKAHEDAVTAVAFCPFGERIASSSQDRTVKVWGNDGNRQHIFDSHTATTVAVAFSSNGKMLVSSSEDRTVRVWDLETGAERCVKHMAAVVRNVIFLPSGDVVQTDRGLVKIHAKPHSSTVTSREPLITQDWTKCDQMLMPQGDYEVTSIATLGKTTILGHASGAISFIGF